MKAYAHLAIFVILILPVVVCAAEPCRVAPYRINSPVDVVTEFKDSGDFSENFGGEEWRIDNATEGKKNGSLIVFIRKSTKTPAFYLDISETSITFKPRNTVPGLILADDLFIFPGSPVPCDILPVSICRDNNNEKIYEIRQDVGGQVFIDRLYVTCRMIDPGDIKSEGSCLQEFFDSKEDQLFLIEVVNPRIGGFLVRQVWSLSHSWWLYEETPHRRSWQKQEQDAIRY